MNNRLRHYTRRNLRGNILSSFIQGISITNWLIFINVFLFILFSIILMFRPGFLDYIALRPAYVMQGQYLWTFLTSMFMHAGLAHLFFNMFTLFFIGRFVERLIGRKRFLWFYLIAGLFAGLFFVLLSTMFGNTELGMKIFGDPNIPGLGASGAIFGLLGILAILTPNAKVYLIIGPLLAIVAEAVLSALITDQSAFSLISFFIQIYMLISLFAIFSFNNKLMKIALPLQISFWVIPLVAILPLTIVGLFVELPIGNMAHFGGFIAGIIFGVYLRIKYANKVKLLNKYIQ